MGRWRKATTCDEMNNMNVPTFPIPHRTIMRDAGTSHCSIVPVFVITSYLVNVGYLIPVDNSHRANDLDITVIRVIKIYWTIVEILSLAQW